MDAYYAARRQYTGWNDINDLLIPTIFLQKNIRISGLQRRRMA